ncbi:hypothetical protein WR164_15520 [Philodulcilactobacillus myokoensis]|uniref:Histidine phosphatase family protein n=1 Tax=Philodulcilactobacillus myokoensis TaxID=2929573 RepID=A0A9W6EU30_9LACO|nr:histidine phosphatase family protein [Philodulcilactobacillus myokoensis]GLB47573.1 hypothetical protein WR164_15520 [Philodulcilactobacillus myokoensis]
MNKFVKIGLIFLMTILVLMTPKMANAKRVRRTHPKIVTIYLARHGQTAGNVMKLDEGWDDYPLTSHGIQVAREVGAGLHGIRFTEVACGKLVRQMDTMKNMLDYSGNGRVIVHETPLFREAGGGKYEMITWPKEDQLICNYFHVKNKAELHQRFGIHYVDQVNQAIHNLDHNASSIPRAESANQVINRMSKGIRMVAKDTNKKHGKNALVVSSADSISAYLSEYDHNLSRHDRDILSHEAIPNAGITKITYNLKTNRIHFGPLGDLSYAKKGMHYLKHHHVKPMKTMQVEYEE